MHPHIVQSTLEARHADLVRQAAPARLAVRSARRRRLSVRRFRALIATAGVGRAWPGSHQRATG